MNRDELEKRNVGENLDSLMNLDPRGYGVCPASFTRAAERPPASR